MKSAEKRNKSSSEMEQQLKEEKGDNLSEMEEKLRREKRQRNKMVMSSWKSKFGGERW